MKKPGLGIVATVMLIASGARAEGPTVQSLYEGCGAGESSVPYTQCVSHIGGVADMMTTNHALLPKLSPSDWTPAKRLMLCTDKCDVWSPCSEIQELGTGAS